jgi:hypothetical protein
MPDLRRPFAVAAILATVLFSTAVVGAAAEPESSSAAVSCAMLDEELGDSGLDCRPLTHDGVDGIFVTRAAAGEPSADAEPTSEAG